MKTCCNKSCDMSHIYHKDCSALVSYLSELCKIDCSCISRSSCDDHAGFALHCKFFECVIIYKAVIIDSVRTDIELCT